ncbi:MAG: EscU/YscU/HrcU family type III secretion system export apparatus switch protein [Planctomycetaceae bacterium]|jgi:flagellar biosynthetic protein FlhB|nr:EscU/YscU/HrcU family type III secretion system export apparatus switch protein [Planctomycetaceae bacterium]
MPEEGGEKTHEPTPRRLEQAREQGQVAKSQDLAAAVVLLIAVVLLMTLGKQIAADIAEYSREILLDPSLLLPAAVPDEGEEPDNLRQNVQSLFHETVIRFMKPLSLFFILLAVIAIAANIGQIGFLWLPDKLAFDITRLDPVKGFGRIFSLQSVMRLVMGILKIVICAVVAWYAVEGSLHEIMGLTGNEENQIAAFLAWTLLLISLKVAAALVVLALIDLMYQRWKHMQDMRMTTEEMREEMKNMIGNPEIMAKRRQIQREMAMKQRVQGTPDADVVVTNPTHYAVAVKFDPRTMELPVVVAKGADYLAFQIRKIAAEHGIPVIERKTLARALFANVEIGSQVSLENGQMTMLAEVLATAYRLTKRYADWQQRNKRQTG